MTNRTQKNNNQNHIYLIQTTSPIMRRRRFAMATLKYHEWMSPYHFFSRVIVESVVKRETRDFEDLMLFLIEEF